MATQDDAPQAIDSNTAEELANRLCRFVLLREHMRKPLSRTDMKAAVMSEHNDRSGRIFKQVLGLANEKMRSIAGVELVAEEADGAAAAGATQGGGTQGATQGGMSQAGATQAAAGGKHGKAGMHLLVNRLPNPVAAEPSQGATIYHAFVEVVLSLIDQSGGTIDEGPFFDYLGRLGLPRGGSLPQPADQGKIEQLVQRRLVTEAFVRRQKKPNDPDVWQYVLGARAGLRNITNSDEFRSSLMND